MREQKTTINTLQKKEISGEVQEVFLELLASRGIDITTAEPDVVVPVRVEIQARDMRLQYVTNPGQEEAAIAQFYDMFGIEKTVIDMDVKNQEIQCATIVDTWH